MNNDTTSNRGGRLLDDTDSNISRYRTMTYQFNNINGGTSIVDPTLISWDRVTKDAIILAILETPNGSRFGVELSVKLPVVNGGQMDSKGAAAIARFKV